MAEFYENLEKLIEKERMHHFESESGVNNLNRIARVLGYADLSRMLADNQFLQMAIVDALLDFPTPPEEWNAAVAEELCEFEDSEDEEFEE